MNLRIGLSWRVLLLAVFACVQTEAALADSRARTATYEGLPLREPIFLRLGDRNLEIPAGYLAPSPRVTAMGKRNAAPTLDFNFWMPDRRYVEIDDISIAGSRPKEPGRDLPTSNQFVVSVRFLQVIDLDDPKFIPPRKKNSNLQQSMGPLILENEFGLVRYRSKDWPYEKPPPFDFYRHQDGADFELSLRCTPLSKPALNPLCDGDVYYFPQRLAFYVRFPREKLGEWRDIVSSVRDLFNIWTVNH